MNIEKQKTYYNKCWSHFNYLNKLQLQRLNAILKAFENFGFKYPRRILDFGCGTGWLTSILNNLGPATSIDLSDKAIVTAKKKYPWIMFICDALFKHPFKKESFDIIVSQKVKVIEHVKDQKIYRTYGNLFKKGGFLILTTPNAFNFNRWDEKQLEAWGMQPIGKWLTQKQLKELLFPYFKILEMRTFISGYGSKGILRLINSSKFNRWLEFLKVKQLFDSITLKLGCGLHIFVVAERI